MKPSFVLVSLVSLVVAAVGLAGCAAEAGPDAEPKPATSIAEAPVGRVTQALPCTDCDDPGSWEPPYTGTFPPVPTSGWFQNMSCPYADKPYMCGPNRYGRYWCSSWC
jgi:hypothetical protein